MSHWFHKLDTGQFHYYWYWSLVFTLSTASFIWTPNRSPQMKVHSSIMRPAWLRDIPKEFIPRPITAKCRLLFSIFCHYYPYTNEFITKKEMAFRFVGCANLDFKQSKYFNEQYLRQHAEVKHATGSGNRNIFSWVEWLYGYLEPAPIRLDQSYQALRTGCI